ncbi:MAG: hypothetical protein AABW83_02520 [Nanoarchaeota archaeon]
MEIRHIKLDYENALESKKSLLSSEIGLLEILKRVKSYRNFRSKELGYKDKLRLELNKFRKKIEEIQKSLPSEYYKVDKRKNKDRKVFKRDRDLEEELNEIKKKLSKLKGNIS